MSAAKGFFLGTSRTGSFSLIKPAKTHIRQTVKKLFTVVICRLVVGVGGGGEEDGVNYMGEVRTILYIVVLPITIFLGVSK